MAGLGGVAAGDDFLHAGDDFADADRTIKDGVDRGQGNCLGARSDQNRGHAFDELLDRGIAGNLRDGFHYDDGGQLARGEGAACVGRGIHPEGVDAAFAKFGANAGAEGPVARDDEDDRHLGRRV